VGHKTLIQSILSCDCVSYSLELVHSLMTWDSVDDDWVAVNKDSCDCFFMTLLSRSQCVVVTDVLNCI